MLAHPYKAKKHGELRNWLASEKLDGIRAFWDGGISRGLFKSEAPWANNDRDERFVDSPRATGLWTRYGNIIHAPDWFLDELPNHTLDGELFTDRKSWQTLSSIVKRIVPDDDTWAKVSYNVFDVPTYDAFTATGLINNPNFTKHMDGESMLLWCKKRAKTLPRFLNFDQVTTQLWKSFSEHSFIRPMVQTPVANFAAAQKMFQEVLDVGGEGLVIRDPMSYWEAKRSHMQVKLKADHDAEAVVTGYKWGRETDRGSKLLGLMGALCLEFEGKAFDLSGFNDEERVLKNISFDSTLREDEGYINAGKLATPAWFNPKFPVGTTITFKYRELSDDGIPKEARFHRKHVGA